nr:TetR-like C-terminal domain-containing protein [Zhihengliuella flava]
MDTNRAPLALSPRGTLLETLRSEYQTGVALLDEDALSLLKQRLIQGLRDPHVQRSYWERHVLRRRTSVLHALRAAQDRGEVRADADLEVVLDLINGAAYYQGVVRGDWNSPESQQRIGAAIDVVFASIRTPVGTDATHGQESPAAP